ncbi:hypothetical protein SCAR479_13457 [Seiridium cardinale]|uniref:Uncharacterized protein n=1 Tax=Seiridium cardinale TaxID=138064 RepID=A0ABR2X8A5_9PEZI
MGVILLRDNDAIYVNPSTGGDSLTVHGSDWLFAVTAVYVVSFLVFLASSFKPFSGERIFHYIFTTSLLVGSIVYFSWASNLGSSLIVGRQIFWVKYIFCKQIEDTIKGGVVLTQPKGVVEFPAIIAALGLLSGVSWATIVYNIFLSWIWIISYLVSAFTSSSYNWGFYAFGTAAWLILAWNTISYGRTGATRLGVSRDHTFLSAWTNLLWLLWPIAFGVTDGGRVIGVTQTTIFFGVLDILLTPVVAFAFLFLSRRWDYNRLNLAFTRYGRVQDGGNFPEKTTGAPAAGGATTTAPAV